MTTNLGDLIETATRRFCSEIDALLTEHDISNGNVSRACTEIKVARKFIRIIRKDNFGGQSIWFLVDKVTGDIFKPAGWRGGPANKIVRGSVLRPAGDFWNVTLSPYGINDAR